MMYKQPITEEERQLLQIQHRLQSVEARDRKKERNMRTRRLIQEGAILESVFPAIQTMELEDIKQELQRRFCLQDINSD